MMFINDQWSFGEISNEFECWIEEIENELVVVLDQDALIIF